MSEENKGGTTTSASASASASPAKVESSAKAESSSSGTSAGSATGIQNGKGDAPRNISPRFRANYDEIRWDNGPTGNKNGQKLVKVYR